MRTRSGRPLVRAIGAVGIAVGMTACRKAEAPAPAAASAPSAPAAASPAPASTPSILETAEKGRAPFSGFHASRGIAVDDRGRVWIADFEHAAIAVYDAEGGYLGGWGGKGDGPYQLKDPCALAVRGDDLYVADTWNGRVLHFSLAGAPLGKAPGDFYGPRGVAVAPDGRVWISDTGNERVVSCEKDLSSPKAFGKKGSGATEVDSPVGIAVGPSGKVYVADSVNKRVQVLDAHGKFESSYPVSGWGPNTEPSLAVDDDENLYATDPPGQAVLEFAKGGKLARRWTADDAGKPFARPTGIALDRKGRRVLVLNTDNDTIAALKLSR
jgi:DNA-binding beta-propeller fold protein YncE